VIRALALALLFWSPGCESSAPQGDRPAVISNPTAQGRAELLRTVREAMNGVSVTLAEDALTRDSTLILEHPQPRDARGLPLDGRATGRPEHFQLMKNGAGCELVHERTGRRWTLTSTTCSPR